MSDPRKRAPKWLRPYLPNRSRRMALVSLNDRKPFRAFWPLGLTQIVGGKTWSLSVVRFHTREPVPTEQFRRDVAAEMDRLRAERTEGRPT